MAKVVTITNKRTEARAKRPLSGVTVALIGFTALVVLGLIALAPIMIFANTELRHTVTIHVRAETGADYDWFQIDGEMYRVPAIITRHVEVAHGEVLDFKLADFFVQPLADVLAKDFLGWYLDAEFTTRLATNHTIARDMEIWGRWR